MDEEIWKPILNYEGLYEISNLGRIKSVKRTIKKRKCIEKIRAPHPIPKGYLRIVLNKNGKAKGYSVHRLVAEAFIPNPYNKPCVNHKDCNVSNNRADNLEWVTYEENNNYKYHNMKKYISTIIHILKKNHPNEKEILLNAEKLKDSILNL